MIALSVEKSKGYNGERWVVEWFHNLGIECNRNYASGAIKLNGLDCDVSSDIGKVEVKTWAKQLPSYLLNALQQGDGMVVYLYARGKGYKYEPYILLNKERFEELVRFRSDD